MTGVKVVVVVGGGGSRGGEVDYILIVATNLGRVVAIAQRRRRRASSVIIYEEASKCLLNIYGARQNNCKQRWILAGKMAGVQKQRSQYPDAHSPKAGMRGYLSLLIYPTALVKHDKRICES